MTNQQKQKLDSLLFLVGYVERDGTQRHPNLKMPSDLNGTFTTSSSSDTSSPIAGTCMKDLMIVVENMKNRWAFEMIDAEAKIPSGILRGNFMWMGDYLECTRFHTPSNKSYSFGGQYCTATWQIEVSASSCLPLKTGLCLPDSCNATEIEENIHAILNLFGNKSLAHVSGIKQLDNFSCSHSHHFELDASAIAYMIVAGIIAFITLAGSCVTCQRYLRYQMLQKRYQEPRTYFHSSSSLISTDDSSGLFGEGPVHTGQKCLCFCTRWLQQRYQNYYCRSDVQRVLQCFCLFSNSTRILSTKVNEAELLCIHGIRVLSMMWIILGHTYIHCLPVIGNMVDLVEDVDNFAFQVILQGTFSVDAFFLLSGFLVCFLLLEEIDRMDGRFRFWPRLFFHRYWRLTPVYAFVLGYVALIFKYTGSGAFWDDFTDYTACTRTWWYNVLYINNFLSINDMCASYTWYLANDMQFFVLCVPLVYILWRWKKVGITVVVTLLFSSWTSTWIISNSYHIAPLLSDLNANANVADYQTKLYRSWDLIYSKPWCRIGPYLVGVLLGYVVYRIRKRKRYLNWWQQSIGWCLAGTFLLTVVFGLYHLQWHYQVLFNFYNSLSRTTFSLGLAWIIYSCLSGHSRVVNRILSYKLWIPLSRLTYTAYLVHPIVMSWYFQSLQQPLMFSHKTMVICYLAFVLMSYGIAYVVSVALESPLMALEKLVLPKR